MFKRPTVFLLGAGASWHYGYPTGEELVQKIIHRAQNIGNAFGNMARRADPEASAVLPHVVDRLQVFADGANGIKKKWVLAQEQCLSLCNALSAVRPPVIDYFLGLNKSQQGIGKFLIAWELLRCENEWHSRGWNTNRQQPGYKDNWYRGILHKLVTDLTEPSDILRNSATFVTFNYDMSLEDTILAGLEAYEPLAQLAGEFFKQVGIYHIYGSLRAGPGQFKGMNMDNAVSIFGDQMAERLAPNALAELQSAKDVFDAVYEASLRLKTIAPGEKLDNQPEIDRAKQAIENAERIYILGYGFDQYNSKILELGRSLRLSNKSVHFTNFEAHNRVSKRASRMFFNDPGWFLPPNEPFRQIPGAAYYEMSVRDVYQALERDFEQFDD